MGDDHYGHSLYFEAATAAATLDTKPRSRHRGQMEQPVSRPRPFELRHERWCASKSAGHRHQPCRGLCSAGTYQKPDLGNPRQ